MKRKQKLWLVVISPSSLFWSFAALILLSLLGIWISTVERPGRPVLASLSGRVIVVDPGHGGPDPGVVGRSGSFEKDVVLEISLALRKLLEASGATVIMTREDDRDLSGMPGLGQLRERKRKDLAKRVEIGNGSGADIYVSVHANGMPSPHWSGSQTFYNSSKVPDSKRLAVTIQRELIRLTGRTRRQASAKIQQYILEQLEIPAVTVEVGFLSNPGEEAALLDPDYQRQVAWSIFVGITLYFMEGVMPASTRLEG